ncbi:MAG: hypothetical protein CMJ39_10410 [Phycisphaerae bacterium]|nr:hypothetical protein [Phycisphaerae bacterium]
MLKQFPILAASLLAVAIILLIDLAGGFARINEQVMDRQQQLLPREVTPYRDEIVLVDVDDGSIDRLGRWPWPRSVIGDAVKELELAGARTIALDIEFSNPQDPTWNPETQGPQDEDSLLSQAIGPSSIMAAVLAPEELDDRWRDADGDPEVLEQLIIALEDDIRATPDDPPGDLQLNDPDQAAFAANQLLVKRRAVMRILTSDTPPESLEALEQRLVPAAYARGGNYAERPLIEAAWYQHEGSQASHEHLAELDATYQGSTADRMPLRAFLERTGGLGYVNITHRGPDGAVRSIYPMQPVRGGQMLTLGLAAVMHYLKIDPKTINQTEGAVGIGSIQLPLHDGLIWLNWPRSETGSRWRDLHRRTEDDPEYRGHLSISEVVELARARRLLEEEQADLAQVSREILRETRQDDTFESDDWLAIELQQEIADEVSFDLDGIAIDADVAEFGADVDQKTRNRFFAMQQWRRANRSIEEGKELLELASETLRNQVEDALVFIGWTSTGAAADFVQTVAGPRTPGVLVHATLADMVLQNRVFHVAPRWAEPLAIVLFGLFISILVSSMGPWIATIGTLLSIALYIAGAGIAALAMGNLLLPLAGPVLAGLAAWICGTSVQAAMSQRDKRRITRQFRARVSEQLVDALIADPNAVSMNGVSREMTIFFADLAGFTTLSESLGSEQVVRILNTYLSALTNQLVEHGAYVNKFLGDGVMAFWSAFREEPAQAHLACAAALACQQTLRELNEMTGEEHPPVSLRVGMATGMAVVGDCGAPPDLNDYTVIGDTANLASRMESANKQFGTGILINGRTHECLEEAPVRCRKVGLIQVVGRQGAVEAWEVVSSTFPQEAIDLSAALADAIADGDQPAARAALDSLRRISGQEKFTERWAEMVEGPSDAFGGPLRLIEK